MILGINKRIARYGRYDSRVLLSIGLLKIVCYYRTYYKLFASH